MLILVADGSRVMRHILMRSLRQAGLPGRLLEAGDGHEALEVARTHDPDLVLCDWDLPGLDGLTLLAALRAAGNDVPVGMVSVTRSAEMAARATRAGALCLVAKPPSPETLLACLRLRGDDPAVEESGRQEAARPADGTLPAPKDVRDLLERLLGRDVEIAVAGPLTPEAGEPATLAVYVDPALRARAVCVADLAFSAHAGAAVGLVPPVRAERAIGRRALGPVLAENLREVLNVAGSLLDHEGASPLRLHAVYPLGAGAPTDVVAYAGTLGRRLDLEARIASYGVGRFSMVYVE